MMRPVLTPPSSPPRPVRSDRRSFATQRHRQRALGLTLLALVLALLLATALAGCSVPSFSTHQTSTSTVASGPGDTRSTTTSLKPAQRTTTSSSTTSSTVRPRPTTTSSSTAVHATTGDPKVIAKKLKPSVVGVAATTASTATMIYQSLGTGVICSTTTSYAYIVTNNHVIERDDGSAAKRIRVTLPSGTTVSATLIGRDRTTDLAVLRVKARKQVAADFRTDLSELARGDFVVAIGNAKVLDRPVTSGNITAILENIDYPDLAGVHKVIESTVPLDHGNSGGPLADVDGRVVGINMAELLNGEGGISLPADLVVRVVTRLMEAAK